MIDLCNEFTSRGFDVTLLYGKLHVRSEGLKEVINTKKIIAYNKKNILLRLLTWSAAFCQIVFLLNFRFRSAHVILVSNPPLNMLVPYFSRLKNYSFYVFDVFPNAFKDFGYIDRASVVL